MIMQDSNKIQDHLLKTLESEGSIQNSRVWASANNWKHDDSLIGVLKRLEGNEFITTETLKKNSVELTDEAELILKEGSPEIRLFNAIPVEGIKKEILESSLGEVGKIGYSQAMRLKWIAFDKQTGKVTRIVQSVKDETKEQLHKISTSFDTIDESVVAGLKKRKLVIPTIQKTYSITKGPKFSTQWSKAETDLTTELLANNAWKQREFKEYNLNALGAPFVGGHLHPLMKVRAQFREIFLEMGFEEMPTNNFVESSFWNFDSLFQPQQHPARDAHDTFFLSDPAEALFFPDDYLERVKEMHSHGGEGSIGWRYDWKIEETKKNILRTHTTAVSSRMLYKLAQEGFTPKKYFSIDRVFRNEALDATHLAEFHQIEGLVADYNLTLGNLMGVISQFFERLGLKNLRFKPAYNPYTEPSMEIFGYHSGLKKWVEVGNSGVFRPEMLLPMGLPPDVRVIAWGLSLERPTMIMYGIENIRDLVGHKISLDFVKNNPICRFDE